ncbi:MAG: GNAT family N-acetyltransferase [Ignavibacteria bacterium]|nr:GNAT family N-acetyltransferase [Ignavibacteria bacterium]
MNYKITKIPENLFSEAVNIYTNAFIDDPLHLFAFPDLNERIRITKLIYEFVVGHIVQVMNLSFIGIFVNNILAGVMTYTTPKSKIWSDELDNAVLKMRENAGNESVNLIGEFSGLTMKHRPKEPHYYLNDLAVAKEYRRRGYAKVLMEYAENECFLNPFTNVTALDTTNSYNARLYEKYGYYVNTEYDFMGIKCYSMYKKIK